jgi:predicted phage-related endonuclease
MKYYYFEIISQNKIIIQEIFSCDSEENLIKYTSYKEQSIRELYNLESQISSKYTQVDHPNNLINEVKQVNEGIILSLETILKNISENRIQMIEYKRQLNLLIN